MLLNVSGFGSTGASGYFDLISEFEGIQTFSRNVEFQIIQQPDGINDLFYGLFSGNRILHQNALYSFLDNIVNKRNKPLDAVLNNRFRELSYEYFNSLDVISWKGKSSFDSLDYLNAFDRQPLAFCIKVYNKLLAPFNIRINNYKKRYYSLVTKDNFILNTKKYLKSLFECSGMDINKDILVEQCFGAENPLEGMIFFDEPISIIVDRDPRDVFILSNYLFKNDNAYMPNDGDVRKFVAYYKALHKTIVKDPRLFYVKFEDLVFRYEDTCLFIENLLHKKHIKKKESFKPELSINNTKLYIKYPCFADEIKYIEENLKGYLYDFESADSTGITTEQAKPF